MEDFSKNTAQQKSKTKIKLALLIVWIVMCAAIFIYYLVVISNEVAIAIAQLSDFKAPNATEIYGMSQEQINAFIKSQETSIRTTITLVVFLIAITASFLAFAIPKSTRLICQLRTERRTNPPTDNIVS